MEVISIILPCYNESGNLETLYRRLTGAVDPLKEYRFEFVFVDDCSRDETPEIVTMLRAGDERVDTLRFSRNCGSHAAVAAGLKYCTGDAAIMLAADLQDPPEIIPAFLEKRREGNMVVWGVRAGREGENPFTRAFSKLFYFLMNRLSDVRQPPTGADTFLVDRAVIDAFNESPEKNTSVYMLIAWLGFSQSHVEYAKKPRHSGVSKWSASKKVKLFFDSLISFSYAPLRIMSFTGAVSALLGMLYGIHVVINALTGAPIQGWSSLMIVVLLLGGFQMIMMGMLGEYLWRTYDETRRRPRYVIEKNTLSERSTPAARTPNETAP